MKDRFDWDFWQQVLGLTTFLVCVFTTWYWSSSLLMGMVADRLKKRRVRSLRKKEQCILLLGGIGVLCLLYGYFIEPYWLSVETIELTSKKIHAGHQLRIVQISDLHCDPRPRLEEQLPDVIRAQKPDIIVFTGDSINTPSGLPIFRKCLTEISKIAPTFVVKGNWDTAFFQDLDRFGNTGATELDGEPSKVVVADDVVWLAGLPIGSSKAVNDVMLNVPDNAYRIFLYHYPDCIEEMARNKIDLYLAGHTHGGQVALPFYGALITLSARGKQYESGLYNFGPTHLYVNRGIGMEGGKAPRVRFCARPEVTVIEISGPHL